MSSTEKYVCSADECVVEIGFVASIVIVVGGTYIVCAAEGEGAAVDDHEDGQTWNRGEIWCQGIGVIELDHMVPLGSRYEHL